jgi:fusion and transport protein UGO1
VPVGPYKGVWGTIWFIVREEGQSVPVSQQVAASLATTPGMQENVRRQPPRRGQGMNGLWRGWRVGFWGLVGMWGASALGGGGEGAF